MDEVIFPVSWACGDVEDPEEFLITVFGKTPAGQLTAVHIEFFPYFFARVPTHWSPGEVRLFIAEASKKHGALPQFCRPVERVSLWGFTNDSKIRLVQLAFPSQRKMRWAAKALKTTHQVFESGMDPLLRFFHLRDISPASWVRVSGAKAVSTKTTRAPIELRTSFVDVGPAPSDARSDVRPPLVFASWDIECISRSRRFPKADNPDDHIIQIATSYQRYGDSKPYKTSVLCFKETAPVADVDIRWFHDEHQMINAWFDELLVEGADVLLGYNTFQFDAPYIHARSLVCADDATGDSMVAMAKLGRLRDGGGCLKTWQLNSGAFGQNRFDTFTTPGVLQIDLLQILRRETKHDSYSLNNMSKIYLQDEKIDLPPWSIFEKFDGSPQDRAVIAEYAAKDTMLPLQLMTKLCIFENLTEMANACYVPVDYVQSRGQQIKVYSVLMRKARQMGYVCPDGAGIGVVGKFTGATVLHADRAAYFDPVAVLDFASLYPSIIRSRNMCYSTIVLDERYGDLPGIEYYSVTTDQGHFKFALNVPSVLPSLLADLTKFRKAAKGDMADAKKRGDAFAEALFNSKQNAFKVTMNSAYGFTGATKGLLACVPIAASVTATGRQMILKAKELAEHLAPGSRVVYGDTDSIMVMLNLDDRQDMRAQFDKAEWLSQQISQAFPPPVQLEFEKVFWPMMLFTKKRYAGLKWTSPDKPDYIDIKGLQLVRRDSPGLVKDVSNAILSKIMYDRSPALAVDEARTCILRVLTGQEPLEKFIVSKTLRSDYKNQAQPHLVVSRKILERTGAHIPSGARVPYVIVEDPSNPDGLLADRAEDPEYVRTNNVQLDLRQYIRGQLESPITTLLELLVDDPAKEVFGHESIAPLLDTLERQYAEWATVAKRVRKNVANNQREITTFFKTKSS